MTKYFFTNNYNAIAKSRTALSAQSALSDQSGWTEKNVLLVMNKLTSDILNP